MKLAALVLVGSALVVVVALVAHFAALIAALFCVRWIVGRNHRVPS